MAYLHAIRDSHQVYHTKAAPDVLQFGVKCVIQIKYYRFNRAQYPKPSM